MVIHFMRKKRESLLISIFTIKHFLNFRNIFTILSLTIFNVFGYLNTQEVIL